jgi:nucleotide-binding universal stress UspA family protein
VDGSEPALRAVRLAAAEAARRDRPLRVVHGFIWPLLHVTVEAPPGGPAGGGLRHQAERFVEAAVAEAEAVSPGLRITGEIIDGEAAAVLLGESPTAAVIVLGDRSAVSPRRSARSRCSLPYADCLVLRGHRTHRRPGGRRRRLPAVPLAVEFARRRRCAKRAGRARLSPSGCPPAPAMQPLVYDESEQYRETGWSPVTGRADRPLPRRCQTRADARSDGAHRRLDPAQLVGRRARPA